MIERSNERHDAFSAPDRTNPHLTEGVFTVLDVVHSPRFERGACPLGGGRSIQLSYECGDMGPQGVRAAGSIPGATLERHVRWKTPAQWQAERAS